MKSKIFLNNALVNSVVPPQFSEKALASEQAITKLQRVRDIATEENLYFDFKEDFYINKPKVYRHDFERKENKVATVDPVEEKQVELILERIE